MAEETLNDASSKSLSVDVGGTLYRVSRSLLEQYPNTMLTRMASEAWQENPNDTLFIERDGRRFAYVLDFMRDAKVSIPAAVGGGITKASVLDELTYFGFENVDHNCIQTEFSPFDAPKYIARLTEDFEKERDDLTHQRDKLNIQIAAVAVAHAVCIRRMGSGNCNVEFNITELHEYEHTYSLGTLKYKSRSTENYLDFQALDAVKVTSLINQGNALNLALSKYGFRMSNYVETATGYDGRDEIKGTYIVRMNVTST